MSALPPGIRTKEELQAMRDTGMCPSCWQPIKNFVPRVTDADIYRYQRQGPDGSAASDHITSFRALGRDPLTGHMVGCQRSGLRYIEEKPDVIVMPNPPRKVKKSTRSTRRVEKPK